MVDYLEYFLPFGWNKGLPKNDILELVDFSLQRKWQNQPLIQGFNTATNILSNIVYFYKNLETIEYIFNEKVDGSQPLKNPIITVQATKSTHWPAKGHTRPLNPQQRTPKINLKFRVILSLPAPCMYLDKI